MGRLDKPAPITQDSGPKHGFAPDDEPSELDDLMQSAPEISALEHAIRMAPAGWSFDSDESGN